MKYTTLFFAMMVFSNTVAAAISEQKQLDYNNLPKAIIQNDKTVKSISTYRTTEPNLPCWKQLWDCGSWLPLKQRPDNQSYFIYTIGGIHIAYSQCSKCGSIRLITDERGKNKRERIVLSDAGRIAKCTHDWKPQLSSWSLGQINIGDYLFVYYNQQWYAIEMTGTEVQSQGENAWYEVNYNLANITKLIKRTNNYKINLTEIKWQTSKTKKGEISFADRNLNCGVIEFPLLDTSKLLSWIHFSYDYYYGGEPHENLTNEPAHIAIVKKDFLGKSAILDLSEFRFKTWEDGLGNLCGETPASQPVDK